jgi:hypothetical protein
MKPSAGVKPLEPHRPLCVNQSLPIKALLFLGA